MSGHNGAAEAQADGVAWHDEQLQRVRAVFDSVEVDAADQALRSKVLAQLPNPGDDFVSGIGAFRDLLRLEHRADRFRRLLRVWSAKVSAEIRAGEFEAAGMWMRALIETPVFAEGLSHLVAGARRDLSQVDLFEVLVTKLVAADNPDSTDSLLAFWGEPLVEYLISQFVTDDPIVNRRHIVDFLGRAGAGDVRHLTARLADPRWFVVRNVATAIGRTGRVSALPALEMVMDHEDERVRVEAIRAIALLKVDGAVPRVLGLLNDPSPKVRQVAASLLRASPAESVVPGIVEVLEEGAKSSQEARRLVGIIAQRRGAAAHEALVHLSNRGFAVGGSRAVRDAAREALARQSR